MLFDVVDVLHIARRMTTAALSFTQVDPAVLSELPQEVRDELAALLPSSNKASHARTDKHHAANTHFEVLRLQHGFEAKQQRRTHNEETVVHIEARNPLADEPVQDLWQALQAALVQIATEHVESSSDSHEGRTNTCSSRDESDEGSTASKLAALTQVAAQWAAAHVQHDLESVHWLLRRLIGLKLHVKVVQQAVICTIQDIQRQVKEVHGAMLQTRSLFL